MKRKKSKKRLQKTKKMSKVMKKTEKGRNQNNASGERKHSDFDE